MVWIVDISIGQVSAELGNGVWSGLGVFEETKLINLWNSVLASHRDIPSVEERPSYHVIQNKVLPAAEIALRGDSASTALEADSCIFAIFGLDADFLCVHPAS